MANNKLQFVPLVCFLLFPITFIVTYSMALSRDHINAFYAYISDTGTQAPEQCWFALLLSLTAFALAYTIYIRYKQVEAFYSDKNSVWMERTNTFAMILGMVAALGVLLVGSFQETNVVLVHFTGAFMSFLGGGIYLTFQAFFTFKMLPMFTNKFIAISRLVIGLSTIVLFFITIVCGIMAFEYGDGFQGTIRQKWDRELEAEANWNLRATSVIAEWVMAAILDVYILSFMLDFRKISFKEPQVRIDLEKV